jgi:hypothetical protein
MVCFSNAPTNLFSIDTLQEFDKYCGEEGSIIYVKDENAFYQVQYSHLVKRVELGNPVPQKSIKAWELTEHINDVQSQQQTPLRLIRTNPIVFGLNAYKARPMAPFRHFTPQLALMGRRVPQPIV